MDGRTNRPSFRDAYLLDALKKKKEKQRERERERERERVIFCPDSQRMWEGLVRVRLLCGTYFDFPLNEQLVNRFR